MEIIKLKNMNKFSLHEPHLKGRENYNVRQSQVGFRRLEILLINLKKN